MPMFEVPPVDLQPRIVTPDQGARRSLTFQLVSDPLELQRLAPAWQELLDASANPEPMRAPSWLLTWWRVYGANSSRKLQVALFRDGERLVGLVPLCKRRYWYRPGIPMTRLEFLGSDVDEQDGVCSDYLGPIARAGYEDRVAAGFVAELRGGGFESWHELILGAMNGAEPMPALLDSLFRSAGYEVERTKTTDAPFLTLGDDWESHLKALEKKKRYHIVHTLRGFEAWAGDDWKLEQVRSADDLVRGQQILWDLHSQRWQSEGLPGVFASPRFAAFHQTYMNRILGSRQLHLLWLTVRGEPVAVHYHILANRKLYFYQCGRSLAVPEHVRIGNVMVALAIKQAITQRLREFDFLGNPAFYKLQFTRTTRPIERLRVVAGKPQEWLRQRAERALDWIRSLRDRLRSAPKQETPAVNKS